MPIIRCSLCQGLCNGPIISPMLIKLQSNRARNPAVDGLVLLYCFTLLQVYDGDGDAILLLDDIDAARESLLNTSEESSPEEQRAFIEVILTFLGNPRTLFRNIAQEAFALFSSDVTSEDLQSLIDLLNTAENEEGQKQIFNQGGDEEEDIGSEESGEEASDVEMIDGDVGDADENDSADSSDKNLGAPMLSNNNLFSPSCNLDDLSLQLIHLLKYPKLLFFKNI